jgi:hypothetical protein
MKTRMKNRLLTHLKYAFASLALLAGLGLGSPVQAEDSAPQASTQQSVTVLAWQRVGAPISMEG